MLNLRDTEINTKGKLPLASLEDIESNETIVSIDDDRFSDLVREGKIYVSIVQTYFFCLNNVYLHVLDIYNLYIVQLCECVLI